MVRGKEEQCHQEQAVPTQLYSGQQLFGKKDVPLRAAELSECIYSRAEVLEPTSEMNFLNAIPCVSLQHGTVLEHVNHLLLTLTELEVSSSAPSATNRLSMHITK